MWNTVAPPEVSGLWSVWSTWWNQKVPPDAAERTLIFMRAFLKNPINKDIGSYTANVAKHGGAWVFVEEDMEQIVKSTMQKKGQGFKAFMTTFDANADDHLGARQILISEAKKHKSTSSGNGNRLRVGPKRRLRSTGSPSPSFEKGSRWWTALGLMVYTAKNSALNSSKTMKILAGVVITIGVLQLVAPSVVATGTTLLASVASKIGYGVYALLKKLWSVAGPLGTIVVTVGSHMWNSLAVSMTYIWGLFKTLVATGKQIVDLGSSLLGAVSSGLGAATDTLKLGGAITTTGIAIVGAVIVAGISIASAK